MIVWNGPARVMPEANEAVTSGPRVRGGPRRDREDTIKGFEKVTSILEKRILLAIADINYYQYKIIISRKYRRAPRSLS